VYRPASIKIEMGMYRWQKEVKIIAFNILKPKGEFTFTPSSSSILKIYGTVNEKLYIRKIQILLFRFPFSKKSLISVFLSQISIPIICSLLQKEKIEKCASLKNIVSRIE